MYVRLKNEYGDVLERKIGFSWTVFFFGWIPMLFFRKDLKWVLITLAVSIFFDSIRINGTSYEDFSRLFYLGMAFIYNRINLNELLRKGYQPASESDELILRNKGFDI